MTAPMTARPLLLQRQRRRHHERRHVAPRPDHCARAPTHCPRRAPTTARGRLSPALAGPPLRGGALSTALAGPPPPRGGAYPLPSPGHHCAGAPDPLPSPGPHHCARAPLPGTRVRYPNHCVAPSRGSIHIPTAVRRTVHRAKACPSRRTPRRETRRVDLDDPTRWLLRDQLGLLTRAQLRDGGVSDAAVRWHLGRHWRIVLPGVYQLDRRPTVRLQREVAALLLAGPGAALSGLTAAARFGLQSADPGDTVHVVVPAPRRGRRVAWASLARTHRPDPLAVTRGALVLTSPARAVLDAATQSGARSTATAIGIEAVQRRLVTIDELVHELSQRNRRGSALAGLAVQAASTGSWSPPEAILLRAVEQSRVLPQVWPNPELRVGHTRLTTPDLWFDDVALAVMVHSRRFHSAGEAWDATVEADADLTAVGIVVVGVTPNRIHRNLAGVVSRIERTYLSARRRPRPPVTTTRRSLLEPSTGGRSA